MVRLDGYIDRRVEVVDVLIVLLGDLHLINDRKAIIKQAVVLRTQQVLNGSTVEGEKRRQIGPIEL